MAQDPVKVDQLQIEPGSGQNLRISRNAATGGLLFKDAVITAGLDLSQLAGLRNIPNVLIVGKSGSGAPYTTIQSAIDAVPVSSSVTNPYVILIMAGVYTETVSLYRDGVSLVGMGLVTLESALEATPDALGCDHTLYIQTASGSTPKQVSLEGIRLTNAHANKACVRIVGGAGSLLGQTSITILNCECKANSAGGNRPIWATAANTLFLKNCLLMSATSNDLTMIEELAYVHILNSLVGGLSCGLIVGRIFLPLHLINII
jgi:hypothetical protein